MGDALVQTAKVFVLVPERVARLAAAFLDALGQLDHLIDGLLAVEPHDVVEAELAAGFLALVWERGKGFDEKFHNITANFDHQFIALLERMTMLSADVV